MKVSRQQMAESRRRILEAAGRLFREKGFEAVGVEEVMKEAGLTRGGFYGHFGSKEDLYAQALAHAVAARIEKPLDLAVFAEEYLSPRHRDGAGTGCPIAALAGDAARRSPDARAAITEGLQAQIARIGAALPDGDPAERRRRAIGAWAAMVGAVILARSSDDPALSDELLVQTRARIDRDLTGAPDPDAG